MKGCGAVLGGLVVVAVVAIGGALWAMGHWPESGEVPDASQAAETATGLDSKFGEVQQARQTAKADGKPVPVTLRITEQELDFKAAELSTALGSSEFAPKNIRFSLVPGKMIVNADVTVRGFEVPATVTALVRVENGQPRAIVESINLGWIPVPDQFKQQLAEKLETEISKAWSGTQLEVQDIRIEQGFAVITGQAQP